MGRTLFDTDTINPQYLECLLGKHNKSVFIYQNLRSRFGIERYAYTETNSVCMYVYVCMYVCMCKNSSQTTEPICIKIIPANRASYADCYRLLRFEIFTKYDEYFVPESAPLCTGVSSPLAAPQRINNVNDVTE